jgi:hypothetical protein
VAEACSLLGKQAVNFYPVRKAEQDKPIKPQQQAAQDIGMTVLHDLPAGRSAILYHQAKKALNSYDDGHGVYMIPNALKLPEMVTETAEEVRVTLASRYLPTDMPVLIAASSGTIAAGVIRGFIAAGRKDQGFIVHQGYDRSLEAMTNYINKMMGETGAVVPVRFVNEGYSYGDVARPGPDPLWPCNPFYDLKAFRWWMREGRAQYGEALLWNIG